IRARDGSAALEDLLRIELPADGSFDDRYEDYKAWLRAVLRALDHAEPATARRTLFELAQSVPPIAKGKTCEELKLLYAGIAGLGTGEDFEFLRQGVERGVIDPYDLLDRFPARLWKGHETALSDIVEQIARDGRKNGNLGDQSSIIGCGMTMLARLGADP